ncbi:MAG TPA: hypothetical protein VNL13_00485 [Sulfolobales archaeon]|nr:hypothetical protein [Sulfolobales archaeon]
MVGVIIVATIFFAIGYFAAPPKLITTTTTAISTATRVSTITTTATATVTTTTGTASDLRALLRSLLIQHGEGHRLFAYSLYYKDKQLQQVAVNELLANSKALGDAVALVYGRGAGDRFTELFNGHIMAVHAYYIGTFAGNETGKKEAIDALLKNAMELATFLSQANPYLSKDAVFSLLRDHGLQAMRQTDLLAQGKISEESSLYVSMRNTLIIIADALSDAIMKQFPDKFK